MKYHVFRLHPQQDLKQSITQFIAEHNIAAGVILACVGSLVKARIRLADETITKEFEEKFEIVSLVGTLSHDGSHLHISVSDKNGTTIGGHLKEGCVINTTAEIVIGELEDVIFMRKEDRATGFKELTIQKL